MSGKQNKVNRISSYLDIIFEQITDENLKRYINIYKQSESPDDLLNILNYFNVKIKNDSVNAIIPYFRVVSYQSIELGAIILDGNFFNFMLKIQRDKVVLEINEIKRITLDKQTVTQENN